MARKFVSIHTIGRLQPRVGAPIVKPWHYRSRPVDPALNPALAEIEKKTGPNNFLRVMAHRPEAMHAFAPLYTSIVGTEALDSRLKEMIYLAVSYVNECDYCASHHIGTGRGSRTHRRRNS